jgi:hypothetical protein
MKHYLTINHLGIKHLTVFALLSIVSIPASVSAATVYLQSSRDSISVGDTAIVTVKIDADTDTINSVEGDIVFSTSTKGDLTIQQSDVAGSVFSLWPETPSVSQNGSDIFFVGGIPGGFSSNDATVFKIIVQAKTAGSVMITPQNISAYANDGKGTQVPIETKDLVINISPHKAGTSTTNDWNTIIATDTTPPTPFTITIVQNPSIFSGKKFALFNAVDNQSGIDYYDVFENGAPAVRSGTMYELQNQSGNVTLKVVAYDKAGNERVATYTSQSTGAGGTGINWTLIIIIIIVLVILFFLYKKIRQRSKLKIKI